MLLFVDQFEELFTLVADNDDRQLFLRCLEGVADDASSPLRIMLAARLDFLDRLSETRAFSEEITRALVLLPAMGRRELEEALIGPLDLVNHQWEDQALIDTILDALESARNPLPLLQFTAAKLWDVRDSERKVLTRSSYERLGGIAGALITHADAVLASLTARERTLVRPVLRALVTEERTRAIVSMEEMHALAEDGDTIDYLLHRLAQARLILIDSGLGQGTTVELIHESLIDRWPTLQQWLAEDQDNAEFLTRLRAAAQQWDKQGRSDDLLWRGQSAADAALWLDKIQARPHAGEATSGTRLGARDRAYIDAVIRLFERSRRRRRRLIAAMMAALVVVTVTVSMLAIRAQREASRAERQAAIAAEQTVRAEVESMQARNASRIASARQMSADSTTVLALLREVEAPHIPPSWAELMHATLQRRIAQVVLLHPEASWSANFSPDGGRIATASMDKTVRVWNADGAGEPMILSGHSQGVLSVSFSATGRQLASASYDRTARVWNADGSGRPIVLSGHRSYVMTAAFSPDGSRIVTASWDRTARIWNADGRGEPQILRGHRAPVWSGNPAGDGGFDRSGTRVLTCSDDNTMRVWDVGDIDNPLMFHFAPIEEATSCVFAPDGLRIGSASHAGHTAWVWTDLEPPTDPNSHRLWSVTNYCLSVETRMAILGVSEESARANRQRCLERVEAARNSKAVLR